jgi:hypothetical protein
MEYLPIALILLLVVMVALVNWRISIVLAVAEEKLKEIEERLAEIDRFLVR